MKFLVKPNYTNKKLASDHNLLYSYEASGTACVCPFVIYCSIKCYGFASCPSAL